MKQTLELTWDKAILAVTPPVRQLQSRSGPLPPIGGDASEPCSCHLASGKPGSRHEGKQS